MIDLPLFIGTQSKSQRDHFYKVLIRVVELKFNYRPNYYHNGRLSGGGS